MGKVLKNKKILIGIIILLIIFVLLAIVFLISSKGKKEVTSKEKVAPSEEENTVKVLEELKNLKVPEPGEKIEETTTSEETVTLSPLKSITSSQTQAQPTIAVPQESIPASPNQTEVKLRTFTLTIKANKIVPREIRVYVGDVVDISVTAVDKDYDLKIPDYGLSIQVNKGNTSKIQFQAYNPGKFVFVCSLCSPEFKGLLLVKPR